MPPKAKVVASPGTPIAARVKKRRRVWTLPEKKFNDIPFSPEMKRKMFVSSDGSGNTLFSLTNAAAGNVRKLTEFMSEHNIPMVEKTQSGGGSEPQKQKKTRVTGNTPQTAPGKNDKSSSSSGHSAPIPFDQDAFLSMHDNLSLVDSYNKQILENRKNVENTKVMNHVLHSDEKNESYKPGRPVNMKQERGYGGKSATDPSVQGGGGITESDPHGKEMQENMQDVSAAYKYPDDPDNSQAANKKTTAYGANPYGRQGTVQNNQRGGADSAPRRLVDRQTLAYTGPETDTGQDLGFVNDESTPSLRPLYGIAGAEAVVPPVNEQIRSDIEFDLFSQVQPGFGEGAANKLFRYDQAREKLIRFAEPMYDTNAWDGPSQHLHPLPWQWQNVKDTNDIANYIRESMDRNAKTIDFLTKTGEGSLRALGRDVPERVMRVSDSGLKRDHRSPFEPVILTKHHWTKVRQEPGEDLEKNRGWKRPFSALRDPEIREVQTENGGPTWRKRRSLEVILE